MNELDARVAVPESKAVLLERAINIALALRDIASDPMWVHHVEIKKTSLLHAAEVIETLRAELQKPALHEPVTDAEVVKATNVYLEPRKAPYIRGVSPYTADIRAVLESFLQGRAKPARVTPYISQEHFDRAFPVVAAKSAQKEITDALPRITDEDQQFLHYNPNTSDLVEWIQDYARAAIRINKEGLNDADLLDFLQANPSLETSCEWCEDGDPPWVVHSVNGGRNDREWREVGRGITLRDAIKASIRASKGGKT